MILNLFTSLMVFVLLITKLVLQKGNFWNKKFESFVPILFSFLSFQYLIGESTKINFINA